MKHFSGFKKYFLKSLAIICAIAFFVTGISFPGTGAKAAGKRARLNYGKVRITQGKRVRLRLSNARGRISWESRNKRIAIVSRRGIVKGMRPGTTIVFAKLGRRKYKCVVTVLKKKTVIEDNDDEEDSEELGEGEFTDTEGSEQASQTAKPTVKPAAGPEGTAKPTVKPAVTPAISTEETTGPMEKPTEKPDISPEATLEPSVDPAETPDKTIKPNDSPEETIEPTGNPEETIEPTEKPGKSTEPGIKPTTSPDETPGVTEAPGNTSKPTAKPITKPTKDPERTEEPTTEPSVKPSSTPTTTPTATPKETATTKPTEKPVATPTASPEETAKTTSKPTAGPTATPKETATAKPTATPTVSPKETAKATSTPTATPTPTPSEEHFITPPPVTPFHNDYADQTPSPSPTNNYSDARYNPDMGNGDTRLLGIPSTLKRDFLPSEVRPAKSSTDDRTLYNGDRTSGIHVTLGEDIQGVIDRYGYLRGPVKLGNVYVYVINPRKTHDERFINLTYVYTKSGTLGQGNVVGVTGVGDYLAYSNVINGLCGEKSIIPNLKFEKCYGYGISTGDYGSMFEKTVGNDKVYAWGNPDTYIFSAFNGMTMDDLNPGTDAESKHEAELEISEVISAYRSSAYYESHTNIYQTHLQYYDHCGYTYHSHIADDILKSNASVTVTNLTSKLDEVKHENDGKNAYNFDSDVVGVISTNTCNPYSAAVSVIQQAWERFHVHDLNYFDMIFKNNAISIAFNQNMLYAGFFCMSNDYKYYLPY
ncbi:MAG: hypothetical protein VZR00_00120 [Lachnospiraceae bacterium]|nr:hypothetical protein [Lachnospiraceae bacterium]